MTVFALLPPPAHELAQSVLDAGAVPVLDATAVPPLDVPEGAWLRVRAGQAAPGTGPILLAEPGAPIAGRECWLEVTEAAAIPEGYAGVVLKGVEAGGRVSTEPVLSLLARHPEPARVIVAGDHRPADLTALAAHGIHGALVAATLLGASDIRLPAALDRRLDLPASEATRVVAGVRVANPATAPVLRQLAAGASPHDLAAGLYGSADPMSDLWPCGRGLSIARDLARAHGTLAGLMRAYVAASGASANAASNQPAVTATSAAQLHRPAPAIAIIGMGCRFPDANNLDEFWQNLRDGRDSIREVPAERWDPDLFWDADATTPDKTYAKIGGFLRNFQFDSRRFRIPPKVAKQIDPVQQICLASVADALADAGLKVDKRSDGVEFDRERCAVVLGNSLGGEVKDEYAIRLSWPDQARKIRPALLQTMSDAQADAMLAIMESAYKADLPEIDEDSMPGELSNVIAGRIANAFDLGGANYTVDAACASSMAALQSAMKSLADGEFDLAITGGADRSMNVSTYVKFCKIGALSPDHSSPFDASANGFVMGEGCGILVLKRYEDAVRDGNRIYAIIRGVGASSDGKGKGITAPNINGQLRALRRAYDAAGIDPSSVDMVECHGTSTVVGDKVEVEALSQVIGKGARAGREPVRIGSVKSQIGHLKSAAAAAAIIKSALALHHGIIPPSINVKTPRQDLPLDDVPLKIATAAEPWPPTPDGIRRAGVSSFGFGGTNFHVVLESFASQRADQHTFASSPVPQIDGHPGPKSLPHPGAGAAPQAPPKPTITVEPPEHPLPAGLWATSARDEAELVQHLELIRSGKPAPWDASSPLRIAAAAADDDERAGQIDRALKVLTKGSNPDMLRARAIHYETAPVDGKLAFVFTGQGSQYLDMGLDLATAYPLVQQTFDEADAILAPTLGAPITDFIRYREGEDKAAKELQLRQTEYSQPATLTVDVAILRLLASFGVYPDLVAGHSLGEYGAAVAAGIMSFEQALYAVSARGREMANIRLDDPGKMAGIAASAEAVEEILAEVDGYVVAANKNCPTQTVIAGASDAVEQAMERFRARGMTVYPLPVSHAFHSRIVAPASQPLRGVLQKLGLAEPRRPITTNVTAEYYTGDVARTIDILAAQIASPVEWTSQIERMYADGARVFVECGPKRALTGFTVSILKRRPHRALYTNHPKRGGVWSFRDCLAGLLVNGMPVAAEPLATTPDLFATPAARRATTEAIEARLALSPETEALPDVKDGILAIVARQTGYDPAELDLAFELEADLGIDTVKQAEIFSVVRETYGIPSDPSFVFGDHKDLSSVIRWASSRIGATQPATLARATAPPAPAVPSAAQAPAPTASVTAPSIADHDAISGFLELAARAGMSGLDAEGFAAAVLPAVQGLLSAAFAAASTHAPAVPVRTTAVPSTALAEPTVVCTGASVGLPGGEQVFAPDNLARILSGDNRISHIGESAKQFLDMNLVRLVKDPTTGKGEFVAVSDEEQVIRLAGVKADFDIGEYGVDAGYARALDVCTKLALAAGIEALRDAGIPLVRRYGRSASGKPVPGPWLLPEPMRDTTGIIFASAFPGYDQMAKKLKTGGDDGEGRFDRRFLFQVLSMGHSQFAQFIGARGPNTAVNAACASTTQAIAIAHDWVRTRRCERVVIISADDVTSDELLPWIGGGFLAAGAATPSDRVEDAALPFDARRHGMILGMGAAALVLETEGAAFERGVRPIAKLLGTTIVNSAFHGTRLDPAHIANAVKDLVANAAKREGTTPQDMAQHAVFMSHETYTPARGGSAAAEIDSLRTAFGSAANQISIANTKGFTGHAMGAGIEDAVAIKAMQYGIVPPIANFQEPDPGLGDLRIRNGERRRLDYGLRLAAGFGSQLALVLWRRVADGDDRVVDPVRRASWLRSASGLTHVEEYVDKRTLRVREATADKLLSLVPDMSPAEHVVLPSDAVEQEASPALQTDGHGGPSSLAETDGHGSPSSLAEQGAQAEKQGAQASVPVSPGVVLDELIALIAQKTGYDTDELESDFELEADLGIDTVKQAEIFSELRDRYGIERDDDFTFADYPTIESLAGYMAGRMQDGPSAVQPPHHDSTEPDGAPGAPATGAPALSEPADAGMPLPAGAAGVGESPSASEGTYGVAPAEERGHGATAGVAGRRPQVSQPGPGEVLDELIALIAEKTGYDTDELESDFELEADLGIDTVKQAEIFSELRDRYGIERDDDFTFADYPTIESLAGYMAGRMQDGPSSVPETDGHGGPPSLAEQGAQASVPVPTGVVLDELIALIAEKTGYDTDELESDFELEADLGIDTVKQAEIFSELRDRYGIERDDDFTFADYPTIESLAGYMAGRMQDGPASTSQAASEPELPPAERDTDMRGEFELPRLPTHETVGDDDSDGPIEAELDEEPQQARALEVPPPAPPPPFEDVDDDPSFVFGPGPDEGDSDDDAHDDDDEYMFGDLDEDDSPGSLSEDPQSTMEEAISDFFDDDDGFDDDSSSSMFFSETLDREVEEVGDLPSVSGIEPDEDLDSPTILPADSFLEPEDSEEEAVEWTSEVPKQLPPPEADADTDDPPSNVDTVLNLEHHQAPPIGTGILPSPDRALEPMSAQGPPPQPVEDDLGFEPPEPEPVLAGVGGAEAQAFAVGPFRTAFLPDGPANANEQPVARQAPPELVPVTALWGQQRPTPALGMPIGSARTIVPADAFIDEEDDDQHMSVDDSDTFDLPFDEESQEMRQPVLSDYDAPFGPPSEEFDPTADHGVYEEDTNSRDMLDVASFMPPDELEIPTEKAFPSQSIDTVPLPESFSLRRPIHVPRSASAPRPVRDRRVLVLGDGPLANAITRELDARGALTGVAPYEAVIDVTSDVLDSFRTCRELDSHPPERWLTVTRLGRKPNVDDAHRDGARAGLTKAVGREWEATQARVLDIVPELGNQVVAQHCCDELFTDGATEVFIDEGARRVVGYDTIQPPTPSTLYGSPLVLVTGGARGITSRVALELARRGPVKLALVGRSPVGEAELDLESEKARIKAELNATGERVRPVDVQNRLKPLIRSEEARQNIVEMASHGAVVRYYTCDLADPEAVRTLVQNVRSEMGPIDVVIHGAGVEESRLIADKDEAAFHRVYDGKALGGHALMSSMPPEVLFVSMGSVAGRFGNAGQLDYAAANDAMARACIAHGHALHLCWTAWDDVGMAVRGGMKTLLEGRGVDLLPADAGAGLLVDMMAAGVTGEIVVAGKLGDFEPGPEHPLIDRFEKDGDVLRAYRTLSLDSDPWIADHAIDKPVLPGVIGIELMVAAARLSRPGASAAGMMAVSFEQPIKLHRGEPTEVIIEARPLDDFSVQCTVLSERTLRTGRVQRNQHFQATVLLEVAPEPEPLPSAAFPDEVLPPYEIYDRFFHGPRFQVLSGVLGVGQDGLVSESFTDDNGIAPGLLTGPLSLEAGFQAAGLHRMLVENEMALPASIDELIWVRVPKPGEQLTVTARLREGVYDLDVDGQTGPVLRARGFELITLGPLAGEQTFPEPEGGRPWVFGPGPEPTEAMVEIDDDPAPEEARAAARVSEGARPVATTIKPDETLLTTLAMGRAGPDTVHEDWLTTAELAEISSRGTDKRIADRRAGRFAAKRAVMALTGIDDPRRITIRTEPSGQPRATVEGFPDIAVSISHREGHAVAAAVAFGFVGVDLEAIEPRPDGFTKDWYTDTELELVGDDPHLQTLVWCAKEAVLKLVGAGMARSPREVEATDVDGDSVTVRVHGGVAEDLQRLGATELSVGWQMESQTEILVSARAKA